MRNQIPPRQPDRALKLSRIGTARIGSAVGAAALIVAVLSLLFLADVTPLVLISVLVAILGIGLWMTLAPDDFRALLTGRRAVHGSNSLLVSVLFTGIMVLVYMLSTMTGISVDLTSRGVFTLKPDVRPVLDNLDRPVQITAFYSRQMLGDLSVDAPILRMFADAAPEKVRLVFVDPDLQPLLARDFGLTDQFGIYISYLKEDGTPDLRFNGTVQMRGDYVHERWIAEAILQLQARGKFRVLFTTGSRELSTETEASAIFRGLESVGIQAGTIDLLNQDIPPDTTALVMLAPWRDFTQDEVDKLARYMAGGGKLLLMAEPPFHDQVRFMMQPDSPLAAYLWATWGIRPQRDLVFDPVSYNTSHYYVRAAQFAHRHQVVVKDEAGTPSQPLFTIAQSWAIAETLPDNVSITPLFATSEHAFGVVNVRDVVTRDPDNVSPGPDDLRGPLVLALAAEHALNGARLIAVGDADWVRNDQIIAFDGQILWTNMIDWLTQFLERVTVSPVMVALPLNVSTTDLNIASVITMLILPGAILAIGGVVWWRRVRR